MGQEGLWKSRECLELKTGVCRDFCFRFGHSGTRHRRQRFATRFIRHCKSEPRWVWPLLFPFYSPDESEMESVHLRQRQDASLSACLEAGKWESQLAVVVSTCTVSAAISSLPTPTAPVSAGYSLLTTTNYATPTFSTVQDTNSSEYSLQLVGCLQQQQPFAACMNEREIAVIYGSK